MPTQFSKTDPLSTIVYFTMNNAIFPRHIGRIFFALLIPILILTLVRSTAAQDQTQWFDHFDGQSSWSYGGITLNQPPTPYSNSWFAAGPWANGSPFLNFWLQGHVTPSHNGDFIQLRLDDKDDAGVTCGDAADPTNCTHNTTDYGYASGGYRTYEWFGYGCYESRLQASPVDGVISSFFLYEDKSPYYNIPEIDWEFFGNSETGETNAHQAQVNFYDGGAIVNGSSQHEAMIDLGFDPTADFHVYGIKWMPTDPVSSQSEVTWYVDGAIVHGPVLVDFIDDIGVRPIVNLWPTDSNWTRPGTFNPQAGELPTYAEYDWIEYRPNCTGPAANSAEWSIVLDTNQNAQINYTPGYILSHASTPFGSFSSVDNSTTFTHTNALSAPTYWELDTVDRDKIGPLGIFPFNLESGE